MQPIADFSAEALHQPSCLLPHPRLEVLRGRAVTVEAYEPVPLELDGEQPGTTPVRFEVVPRALRVRVPSGQ